MKKQKPTRIFTAFGLIAALAALIAAALLLSRRPSLRDTTPLPAEKEFVSSEIPTKFPDAPRIVAIGDLHGDLEVTRAVLRLVGAIDSKDKWIGKDLVVVQTGDVLDRGDDDRQILDLIARLEIEADATGGAFHALIGNHELMNVSGNYKYVSARSMVAFDDMVPGFFDKPELAAFAPAQRGRAAAFVPGGPVAKTLAKRDVAAIVGDSVFVHGGVLPEHAKYGLDRINKETRAYLKGEVDSLPAIMDSRESPVWTRLFSLEEVLPESTCETLQKSLDLLNVKRMVVGHTVHEKGISSACDNRVFRIDTGMSEAYVGSPPWALEITGDKVAPLTGERP